MTLLLDTHVLLWWAGDEPRLGDEARRMVAEATEVWVSAVTGWEIEIKRAAGRLSAPEDLEDLVVEEGFVELPFTLRHAIAAGRLPPHHRDPFDRALVAQATTEGLQLLTADRALAPYEVSLLDATR